MGKEKQKMDWWKTAAKWFVQSWNEFKNVVRFTVWFRIGSPGAILFRGFHVTEGAEFENILKQYEPELSDEYRGVSPRKLVPGTKVWYRVLNVI